MQAINDWGNSVDTPAANDKDEIEILGSTGNYYIYIKSWDNQKDEVEPEIYDKVTLTDDSIPKNGSRGSPSIPAWNSGNWIQLGADNVDSDTDAVDILNADDGGSRYDNLMYYADGEFMYFMMFLEADPDAGSYTYSVLLEDSANSGDYDYVISSFGDSNARLYSWNPTFSEWDTAAAYGSGYFRYETTNGQEHVALAVKYSDSFTPDSGSGDAFKAATSDNGFREFSTYGWRDVRNPTPNAATGDYTTATQYAIPEFSTLLMPIASVALIVGTRVRIKKNTQH